MIGPTTAGEKHLRQLWEELLASGMYFRCSAERSILPILLQAAHPQESEDRDAGWWPEGNRQAGPGDNPQGISDAMVPSTGRLPPSRSSIGVYDSWRPT